MKGFHFPLALAVIAAFSAPLALAADPQLSSSEQKFVKEAAVGGMAEVELADLAQQNAGSDQVKQLAQRIKQDHQQANQQLQSLASQKGVQLPADLDRKHQHERDRLAKLQGAEFDKEYVKLLVKDHKSDVSDFEKQANKGKDSDIRSFAAQVEPKLREHLQEAQRVQAQLKSGKSKSSS